MAVEALPGWVGSGVGWEMDTEQPPGDAPHGPFAVELYWMTGTSGGAGSCVDQLHVGPWSAQGYVATGALYAVAFSDAWTVWPTGAGFGEGDPAMAVTDNAGACARAEASPASEKARNATAAKASRLFEVFIAGCSLGV